jgi:hypothetical protein
MALVELGQQTASGISFMGVKQSPPEPSLSFTPVKKIPITTRSTVIASRSLPSVFWISSTVSSRIEPGRASGDMVIVRSCLPLDRRKQCFTVQALVSLCFV